MPELPTRKDVVRNRERLLDAARRLITERGLTISYDEIAAAARVGVGTAYRHFPERADLLDALFRDHLDDVVALATAAGDMADPLAALTLFLESMLERQAAHRGLSEVLRGRGHPALVQEATERVSPVVAQLLTRAAAAGAVADSVVPGDLVLVEFMVAAIMDAATPADPDLWRRALSLVLTGLRAGVDLDGPVPDAGVITRLYAGQRAPRPRPPA